MSMDKQIVQVTSVVDVVVMSQKYHEIPSQATRLFVQQSVQEKQGKSEGFDSCNQPSNFA